MCLVIHQGVPTCTDHFFHRCINSRVASNGIQGIEINGFWIMKPNIIKKEVISFFNSRFKEVIKNRPTFVCPGLKPLSTAKCTLP